VKQKILITGMLRDKKIPELNFTISFVFSSQMEISALLKRVF